MRLEVVVHDLAQAKGTLSAARDRGITIQLRSASGASAYAGVGYLKTIGDAVNHELLIDCQDDAGVVMAALRAGCRKLTFSGDPQEAERLRKMAESLGASLRGSKAQVPPVLTLSPEDSDRAIRSKLLAALKRCAPA